MRMKLAPLLFQDADREGAQEITGTPVAKSVVLPSTKKKAASKKTTEGLPVHNFGGCWMIWQPWF